jgi:hypothetical protein
MEAPQIELFLVELLLVAFSRAERILSFADTQEAGTGCHLESSTAHSAAVSYVTRLNRTGSLNFADTTQLDAFVKNIFTNAQSLIWDDVLLVADRHQVPIDRHQPEAMTRGTFAVIIDSDSFALKERYALISALETAIEHTVTISSSRIMGRRTYLTLQSSKPGRSKIDRLGSSQLDLASGVPARLILRHGFVLALTLVVADWLRNNASIATIFAMTSVTVVALTNQQRDDPDHPEDRALRRPDVPGRAPGSPSRRRPATVEAAEPDAGEMMCLPEMAPASASLIPAEDRRSTALALDSEKRHQLPARLPSKAAPQNPTLVEAGTLRSEGAPRPMAFDERESVAVPGPQAPQETPGILSDADVRGVVRDHIGEVVRCYKERGQRGDDTLQGRIRTRFTISRAGEMTGFSAEDIEATRTENLDAPAVDAKQKLLGYVADCIEDAMARWKFPIPRGGGNAIGTYLFILPLP